MIVSKNSLLIVNISGIVPIQTFPKVLTGKFALSLFQGGAGVVKFRHSRAGGNLNAPGFFLFPATQSCLGWPPNGFYFWLSPKVTKAQDLELMSDKLVETLFATATRNEEKSFLPLFWLFRVGERLCASFNSFSFHHFLGR